MSTDFAETKIKTRQSSSRLRCQTLKAEKEQDREARVGTRRSYRWEQVWGDSAGYEQHDDHHCVCWCMYSHCAFFLIAQDSHVDHLITMADGALNYHLRAVDQLRNLSTALQQYVFSLKCRLSLFRIPRTAIINKEVNVERLKLHNRSDISRAAGDRDDDYSGRGAAGYVNRDYSQESILSSAAQAKNRAASVSSIDHHSRQGSANNFGMYLTILYSNWHVKCPKRREDRHLRNNRSRLCTTLKLRVLMSSLVWFFTFVH